MSEACLKQHLFASSSVSSHLHTTGSNFSVSHICRIRPFWPGYEVPREGPLLCKPFLLAMFCPPYICKSWYRYYQMLVHWSKHSERLFQGAVVQSDIMELQFLWYLNTSMSLLSFPIRESKVALTVITPTGKCTGYDEWCSWLACLAPLI